jgi:hypothetical protein
MKRGEFIINGRSKKISKGTIYGKKKSGDISIKRKLKTLTFNLLAFH